METHHHNLSNIISHPASDCKHVPSESTFEAWQRAEILRKSGVAVSTPTPDGPTERQRQVMVQWGARAIENPQREEVTQKTFRERYVKALVEDDLPFGFGHKGGMKKLFHFVLPKEITVPSASTVSRDLVRLWTAVDANLTKEIRVRTSMSLSTLAHVSNVFRCSTLAWLLRATSGRPRAVFLALAAWSAFGSTPTGRSSKRS